MLSGPMILQQLFGLRSRVSPLTYMGWGFGLAAAKFALDSAIVYAFTRRLWSPLGYLVPSVTLRAEATGTSPEAMLVLLPIVALPFLWIGLSMSVRRAVDAGVSAWWGMLFVVPLVNYGMIAALLALPSRLELPRSPLPDLGAYRALPPAPSTEANVVIPEGVLAALAAIAVSVAIGVSMLWLCIYGFGLYGWSLFFLTPFAMGAVSAVVYNARRTRSAWATASVATAAVLLAGSIPLLFALEGLLCIAMAAPAAVVLAIFGALVGRQVFAMSQGGAGAALPLLLALPGSATAESRLAQPQVRDVTTSVEIAAPPERVWNHVVGFSELPPPREWFFRVGIAYPKAARIAGSGVGAVRRCEFSTGAFVEPITVWSPPTRLAFDVREQPPSMTEWSFYETVVAPHLKGTMVSKGGEFDLVPLPGGATRLEGTTHYALAMYPEAYWRPFAEALLHAIHRRVLLHVKALSEADRP
jgi:uncharacterized membrane protein YhaH (DUF805 family)